MKSRTSPAKSCRVPAQSARLPRNPHASRVVLNRSRKILTSALEIPEAPREILTPPAKSQVVPAKSCAPATDSQAAVCEIFACSSGVRNPFQRQRRGIFVEPAPKRKSKLRRSDTFRFSARRCRSYGAFPFVPGQTTNMPALRAFQKIPAPPARHRLNFILTTSLEKR